VRIRTNDTVLVTKGKDRGKRGQIQRSLPAQGKVVVEGLNMVKRHTKAAGGVRQAGIIDKEMPLRVENVVLLCTHCNRPTRVGLKFLADGTKARVCKKCQEVIE
jgi:large subunit ribosomal protein L24